MKKLIIASLFFLSACSYIWPDNAVISEACRHERKLRDHFLGYGETDVSTLIRETKVISAKLKAVKRYGLANKFDSYLDVLMYGNKTLKESIRDMRNLMHGNGVCPESCY